MKKESLKKLKEELWRVFSIYIRTRDNFKCISCGKQLTRATSQAGHYIPKSMGLIYYFNEKDTNCQCLPCNIYLHGNLAPYALGLIKKYGVGVLYELDSLKGTKIKYTRDGYLNLIKQYHNKLDALLETRYH